MQGENLAAQLLRQFDKSCVENGARNLADGKLERLSVSADKRTVTALVGSPDSKPYRCYVRVHGMGDNRTFDGECTCRRAYNCEHVAAALLGWADGHQADTERPTHNPPPTQLALHAGADLGKESRERIVYLLKPTGIDNRHGPHLLPTVCHVLPGGELGQPRPFQPLSALSAHPARFVLPEDVRVMQGFVAALPELGFAQALVGIAGARLLHDALRSKRCFLDSPSGRALVEGDARQIDLTWRIDALGEQTLHCRSASESVVLFPIDSIYYLNAENGDCGIALSADGQPWPGSLLHASPIAAEASAETKASWATDPNRQHWPAPKALELHYIRDSKPIPKLSLDSVAAGDADPEDLAVLNFDYAGRIVSPLHSGAEIRQLSADHLEILVRDERAERAAQLILRRCGLRPADPLLDAANAPAQRFKHERAADGWVDFLEHRRAALRRWGWAVEVASTFRFAGRADGPLEFEISDQGDWFSMAACLRIGDQKIDVLPLILRLLQQPDCGDWLSNEHRIGRLTLPMDDGRYVSVPAHRIAGILKVLVELHDLPRITDGALRLPRFSCGRLAELEMELGERGASWLGGDDLRELGRSLQTFSGLRGIPSPPGLGTQLRDYQRTGLSWLQFIREYGLGGVLADDMGLGKTVQILAHLLVEKAAGRLLRPTLVITPTSVAPNWLRETKRFASTLKVVLLSGANRAGLFSRIDSSDLVITTYPLLARDGEKLKARTYSLVVLDEAQTVKNPVTQKARLVRGLTAQHRVCLTGTPMENHLGELWSLFDFLMPGFLGDQRRFNRLFRRPIERESSEIRRQALIRRIGPFLLRRTKQAVAKELPEKIEIEQAVELAGDQRELYESIRLAMFTRVQSLLQEKGLVKGRIEILDAILKLRQVCCDPRLVKLSEAHKVKASAKLEMLMDMLPELVEEGRKILVFSQFTSMLALIADELKSADIAYAELTGKTRDRAAPVDLFQSGAVPVFLISLKAGGVGLNLTAADTVIHYDPWWNPAAESQATDRAYRIGQDKNVFVYRLLVSGSVETHIQTMKSGKAKLAEAIYGEDSGPGIDWNEDTLTALFEPLESGA